MNQLLANLASARKNPHVSIPAAIALACQVGKVWLPKYAVQFDATQKIFVAYGMIAAANSAPGPKP